MRDIVIVYGLEMVFDGGEMVVATMQHATGVPQLFVETRFDAKPFVKALCEIQEALREFGEALLAAYIAALEASE